MLGRFRCVQILETECGEIFIYFQLPTRMILDTLIFLISLRVSVDRSTTSTCGGSVLPNTVA